MIKKIAIAAIFGAMLAGNTGCSDKKGDFINYKGISYKIVRDAKGKKAQIGDIIEFHLFAKVDSQILGDSRAQQKGMPMPAQVEEPQGVGQYQAVFTKMGAGDSAVLEISIDTLLKAHPIPPGQQAPPWIKPGKKIFVTIAVVSVKSQEEAKKEAAEKQAAQTASDDKALQDYFAKNSIKATKTASGLYYTVTKPGSGDNAKQGQMVTMKYIGKTLEGKQFDANMDESFKMLKDKKDFSFPIGVGQVIKGWDEGVQLLNKGSRAMFYIPSTLAYGPQAMGPDLPANATLVFTVEVVDIKDAPKQEAPAQGPNPGSPQGNPTH